MKWIGSFNIRSNTKNRELDWQLPVPLATAKLASCGPSVLNDVFISLGDIWIAQRADWYNWLSMSTVTTYDRVQLSPVITRSYKKRYSIQHSNSQCIRAWIWLHTVSLLVLLVTVSLRYSNHIQYIAAIYSFKHWFFVFDILQKTYIELIQLTSVRYRTCCTLIAFRFTKHSNFIGCIMYCS